MKTRRANPVKIGIFVVGGLVILTAGILWLGSGRLFRRTHPFVSYFDGSVNGLRAGGYRDRYLLGGGDYLAPRRLGKFEIKT